MTNTCCIATWPNGKSLGWEIFAVGSNPVSGDFLFIYVAVLGLKTTEPRLMRKVFFYFFHQTAG